MQTELYPIGMKIQPLSLLLDNTLLLSPKKFCDWIILPNLGTSPETFSMCVNQTPKTGVFFCYFAKYSILVAVKSQLVKILQQLSLHEVDRGYPAVRFEYKTASEQYLVAEL